MCCRLCAEWRLDTRSTSLGSLGSSDFQSLLGLEGAGLGRDGGVLVRREDGLPGPYPEFAHHRHVLRSIYGAITKHQAFLQARGYSSESHRPGNGRVVKEDRGPHIHGVVIVT